MYRCVTFLFAVMIVIVIIVLTKYQRTKSNFLSGMWLNSKEGLYMYIDDKVKDSWRGGYIVQEGKKTNEPFKIKTSVGVGDDVKITTQKSDFLKKDMVSKLNMSDGKIEITDKNGKKHILYKDTESSNDMKDSNKKNK